MTSNALAIQNGNLAVVPQQDFTAQQIDLIKRTIMPGATEVEFATFLNLCKAKRLDPLTRQIYAIKPRNGAWQTFASIDGLRVIAERSGKYGGQTAPLWCGPDEVWREVWLEKEPPSAAKVGVWKQGYEHPTWGVATWRSYGAGKANTWDKMPDVMLAKCAEALALRKAFPDDLSALYVREEFEEAEPAPAPSRPAQVQHRVPNGTPVIAEVVHADPETGEIQFNPETATQKQITDEITRLRSLLGWTEPDLRDYAAANKVGRSRADALRMIAGLQEMIDHEYGDEEEDEPEQGTLLDADTAPINDRWE